jgi:hypothetical protein
VTRTARRVPALLLAAGLLSACGGGASITLPGPGPETARGVPGFDTRDYPGDTALRTWKTSSPYRWVGFYLEAPCYTGTGWLGKRSALEGMGWGIAMIFVGEQDWPQRTGAAAVADSSAVRCTRDNLTADRGGVDARAAADAAASEGFAPGAWIYLDVERVDSVSVALEEYVGSWTAALLADGRYRAGLYAHENNADRLMEIMRDAGEAQPRLWVAKTGGFSLRRGPGESGFSEATIWQGILDARETWGGVTLRIDANVAAMADPSG